MAKEKMGKLPDKKKKPTDKKKPADKKKKPTTTSGRKGDRKRSENKVGRKQKPG